MLSGLKFIPRDQIDDKTHDENINDSDTRKSYKKKKKSHHSNSSDDDTQRIKKKSKKKWYSSEEDSSSYSDASESNSDQDTRRHKKKKKEKKHKGKSEPKEKGKSKKSKRKEYSSDDDDCPKEDNKSKDNIVRKEMGLEWMLKPKDDLDKKPASTSDLLEETPTKEIKKSNPRELNPYFKNDGTGYPEEENEEGAKSGDTNLLSTSVVGDGGASWRLKALKRAQEQAAREGKNLDEVVGERWGSLGKLAVSVASHSAAPSRAHLHAIKNRQRLQNKDQKTPPQNQTENERDSEKRTPSQHGGMRVPKSDGSLSWGKKKSQSQSQSQKEDAGVISSALSSLQKFSNDGSFLNQFKSQKNEDLSSSSSNVSKSEEPSLKKEDTNTIVKPALSANQLAAKVVQLRMKGKHEEADKLLKETEVYEEKSQAGIITNNPQGDGSASRYIMHGIKARKEKKEEDADMHVARSIMQNKQYTNVSNQADDEYEYDDGMGPKRKKKNKESQKSMGNNNTRFEKRILTQQERCNFCFENPKRPRHLVVAIANFTYLMLPQFQPLVPGHCYILPMQHELATRSVDDNVWDEIRNFKKCLLMMFAKQEKDVIFLETVIGLSKQTRHCLIECIPLPPDVAKQGPLYFKKAIDEAEDEWSQHNAKKLIDTSEKGLRHSIPKDFPYFHVEFGLKKGFVHVIDDESQFKASFGINVVRGMLRLPAEDMHRHRQKHDSVDTQKEAVGNFVRDWADFDWTKQLDS